MIQLFEVNKSLGSGVHRKRVLHDLSGHISTTDGSLAILGAKSSGKTTLVNLLAGADIPDSGHIRRKIRISWPLGWRGLDGMSTLEEVITLISKFHGGNSRKVFSQVCEFSEVGDHAFKPLKLIKKEIVSTALLSAAFAINFDIYLLDGMKLNVPPALRQRFEAMWSDLIQSKRVIITASNFSMIPQGVNQAVILSSGKITNVMPIKTAATLLGKNMPESRPAL
jgi:capsular polysaccharide transport system ATP-binding protein